jgi:CRISPR-associated endonuclease/helicase Cas3
MDLPGIVQWLSYVTKSFPLSCAEPPDLQPTVDDIFIALKTPNTVRLRKLYSDLGDVIGFLAAFGALLSEDKLDTALEGAQLIRCSLSPNLVDQYKDQFFNSSRAKLSQIRETLARAVQQNWLQNLEQHHLTLSAPTGSGKTLAILGAALKVRSAISEEGRAEPRIIYCLPFTSIIDQNHRIFSDVLENGGIKPTQDILLKHHHLTNPVFRTQMGLEYEPDGAGELLTETWQSEIVVTTFYQFLYTFLSAANRNLKRAAQVTEAIVLLDEVQAIPLKYWNSVRQLLKAAAYKLGTRFVLLTATRPLIYRPGDAVELLPDHESYFRALSRVRLLCHHKEARSISEFIEQLPGLGDNPEPLLIVVNRRRTVAELFRLLRKAFPRRPVFALSTNLTPQHRRKRIQQIRASLDDGNPCIAITTQLIEAGVDISFPRVHRDLAPLDSIIQAAGRCNRHMELRQGEVHLWQFLDDKGSPQWRHVYDAALIEATQDVLGTAKTYEEADFLSLTERYFQVCWERADQEPVHEILSQGSFDQLNRFQLIEDGPPTKSFFIIANSEDQLLWDRYLEVKSLASPAESLKAFAPFRREFFDRVIQVYGQSQEEIEALKVEEGHYDLDVGFMGDPDQGGTLIL